MLVFVVLIWRWAILPSLPLLQKTVTDVTSRGRSDCKTAQLLASGLWLNRLLANEWVANVTNDHKQKSAWAHKLIRKVFTVIKLESCFVDFFTIQSFCWSSDRMQVWGQLYFSEAISIFVASVILYPTAQQLSAISLLADKEAPLH